MQNDDSSKESNSNELMIARRTRSRVRMDDYVLIDNLDFPDVDKNLYHDPDSPGDIEYKNFLRQTYSIPNELGNDTNTDDNDPAYVYNDDIFCPGWRYNLFEGLQEQEQEEEQDRLQQQHQHHHEHNQEQEQLASGHAFASVNAVAGDMIEIGVGQQQLCVPPDISNNITDVDTKYVPHVHEGIRKVINICDTYSPNKLARVRKIDMFGEPEFARVLNQQLRQHIQLLTQTYLLTKHTSNLQDKAYEAEGHLNAYMKVFKNKSKPSNLLPAIELVKKYSAPKDIKSSVRLSWRHLPVPGPVKAIIDDNVNVFMYSNLLPQVAYSLMPQKLIPKTSKIIFTLNEDKLLAYALNEFKGESSQYAYIASLLMAAKTKMQINNHIKNIKRSPGNENNPIKLYLSQGKLPEIDLDGDSELRQIIPATNLSENNDFQEKVCPVEEHASPRDAHLEEQPPAAAEEEHLVVKQNSNVTPSPQFDCHDPLPYHNHDDMMNLGLDDLMAASTTISKSIDFLENGTDNNNANNNISEKNIKNLKLRKSMLNLMSHKFLLSEDMDDLIIGEFLKVSHDKLSERNYLHLLQLMTDLMRLEAKNASDNSDSAVVSVYNEITRFLTKIGAPQELHERMVLFLNLDQASKCDCAVSYLHWMRFFEFVQHVAMYHEGEAVEKKLIRLIDAIQKNDSHKIKLATANLVNKHPFLQREFDSLCLTGKPHASLFISEEDFDDITEPISMLDAKQLDNNNNTGQINEMLMCEHFNLKPSLEEANYGSQSCPCKCHKQLGPHCNSCNLKFMKGRMYLVSKIKPFLAEWSYSTTPPPQQQQNTPPAAFIQQQQQHQQQLSPPTSTPVHTQSLSPSKSSPIVSQPSEAPGQADFQESATNSHHLHRYEYDQQRHHEHLEQQLQLEHQNQSEWTFEEDREILEFCRSKAEQNDDNVSFDTTTFEELVNKRRAETNGSSSLASVAKKSARAIAERFNHLMEMYRIEGS